MQKERNKTRNLQNNSISIFSARRSHINRRLTKQVAKRGCRVPVQRRVMPRGRLDKAIPFLQHTSHSIFRNQWLFEKKLGYRNTCSSRAQNVCRSHSAIQVYTKGFLAAPGDIHQPKSRRTRQSQKKILRRLVLVRLSPLPATGERNCHSIEHWWS